MRPFHPLLKLEHVSVTLSLSPPSPSHLFPSSPLPPHTYRVQLFYCQIKLNWQRLAGLKGIKKYMTDRQRNSAKLWEEKRSVRGTDKGDRGGEHCSLAKHK